MKLIKIDPMDHPLREGESWWVIPPNYKNCEFHIPQGAVAVCSAGTGDRSLNGFDFQYGRAYQIVDNDPHNGWLTVCSARYMVRMPYYVFARHFDAEAFIKGSFTIEGKEAKPFDYKPTVPAPVKKQLELFDDNQYGLRAKDEPEWRR
jgi:hypothetical protein